MTPAKRFVVPPPSSRTTPNIRERRRTRDHFDDAFSPEESPRPKPRFSKVESIDTTSPSSSANAEVHDGFNILQTVERVSVFEEDESHMDEDQDEEDEILFVREERNKRRRVSSDAPTPPTIDHSDPLATNPQSSPQIASPVSHRFKVPAPRPNLFENTSTLASSHQPIPRPHFILPQLPTSPSKSAVPLPETFSPSRKNGKYMPNGMAATLQSWIHETASTGYAANTNSGVVSSRDKENGMKMRVEILNVTSGRGGDETEVECRSGGVVFVRGTIDGTLHDTSRASGPAHAESDHQGHAIIKMLLAGQGGARGKGGVCIRTGSTVGVRAPFWDVHIGTEGQEETWLVAVEWVVL